MNKNLTSTKNLFCIIYFLISFLNFKCCLKDDALECFGCCWKDIRLKIGAQHSSDLWSFLLIFVNFILKKKKISFSIISLWTFALSPVCTRIFHFNSHLAASSVQFTDKNKQCDVLIWFSYDFVCLSSSSPPLRAYCCALMECATGNTAKPSGSSFMMIMKIHEILKFI